MVEPDAYVVYSYRWSITHNKWLPVPSTSYFDGVEERHAGALKILQNAAHYIELLCTYSGFVDMGQDEANTDTLKEETYINSLNSCVDKEVEQ